MRVLILTLHFSTNNWKSLLKVFSLSFILDFCHSRFINNVV